MPSRTRALSASFVLALLAGLLSVAGVAQAPAAGAAVQSWTGSVTSVIDGDTFWVNSGGSTFKVRVLGIDTNETGDCWAAGATGRLAQLIDGKTVRLEARSYSSSSLDRKLRHVFVQQGSTWVNVAEVMLAEGWGLPMRNEIEPEYGEDYVAAAVAPAKAGTRVYDSDSCGGGSTAIDMWVNADAHGDDTTNINGEWVRLVNRSSSAVSIGGWMLRSDGRLGDNTFTFPGWASIPGNGSIRVFSGSGTATSTKFYWGHNEAALGNDIGVMFLRDTDVNVRAWSIWPCEGGCGPTGTVVIEEVDYDAPGSDTTNVNGERIRMRNVGPDAVNLFGWVLTNNYNYYFDQNRVLDPGEQLELRVGIGNDTASVVYWDRSTPALPNSGGVIRLSTPYQDLSDCFDYGSGTCAADGLVGSLKLWVNYNAPGSDTANPNGEYVAIENISRQSVNLGGFSLHDPPHVYTFGSTWLSPGAMVRVKVGSGTDTGSTKYWGKSSGIFTNSGDSVLLKDNRGNELIEHAWPCGSDCGPDSSFVIDKVNYNAPGYDSTNPNGEYIVIKNTGNQTQNFRGWQVNVRGYQLTSLASRPIDPGETVTIRIGSGSNSVHNMYWGKSGGIMRNSGDSVKLLSPHRETIQCHAWGSGACSGGTQSLASVIELTANPDANGSDSSNPNGEWVNVTNTSSSSVSLNGYELYTDGLTYRFDSADVLTAGQRIRVRMGNGTDSYHYRYWGVGANLSNSADEVALRKSSDKTVVTDVSWPCASPCGPRPNLDITTVKYDPAGSDNENVNGEYIVIKNNGSTSVNVRDWQLVYKNTVQFNWAANRILDPGEKLTVYMGQGSGSNHKVYMGRTTSRLANSGGKVELLTPHKDEVSCADWGSWSC